MMKPRALALFLTLALAACSGENPLIGYYKAERVKGPSQLGNQLRISSDSIERTGGKTNTMPMRYSIVEQSKDYVVIQPERMSVKLGVRIDGAKYSISSFAGRNFERQSVEHFTGTWTR